MRIFRAYNDIDDDHEIDLFQGLKFCNTNLQDDHSKAKRMPLSSNPLLVLLPALHYSHMKVVNLKIGIKINKLPRCFVFTLIKMLEISIHLLTTFVNKIIFYSVPTSSKWYLILTKFK